MFDMRGSFTFVTKILYWTKFRLQFSLQLLPQNHPKKNKYLCIAALYINTDVSFKSNITKIYYCWPPIFDPTRFSYSKRTSVFRISSKYWCMTCVTMPTSQGISIWVRENLTLSRSQREVTYFCILTEVKHVSLAENCFKKLNDKQI